MLLSLSGIWTALVLTFVGAPKARKALPAKSVAASEVVVVPVMKAPGAAAAGAIQIQSGAPVDLECVVSVPTDETERPTATVIQMSRPGTLSRINTRDRKCRTTSRNRAGTSHPKSSATRTRANALKAQKAKPRTKKSAARMPTSKPTRKASSRTVFAQSVRMQAALARSRRRATGGPNVVRLKARMPIAGEPASSLAA